MLTRSAIGSLLLTALTVPAAASAPERTAPLTLPEAVQLARRTKSSIRAKQRHHEATRAGETTAGLLPNPTASYLAERLGSSGVSLSTRCRCHRRSRREASVPRVSRALVRQ